MDAARVLGIVVCVFLLGGVANATTEIVDQTLDHTDVWFFPAPDAILDHSPYYRGSWEDAEWTHDMTSLVPGDAVGIQSATLSIDAWDVDGAEGEIDVVSANGVELGALSDTGGRFWGTSEFALPTSLLDQLWQGGQLNVSVDIDAENTGQRVTLGSSTLSVTYIVPEPATVGLLGLGGLLLLKRRRS